MKNNSIQCGCVEANLLPANIVLVNSFYNLLYKLPPNTYIIYSKKGLFKGIIIIFFHILSEYVLNLKINKLNGCQISCVWVYRVPNTWTVVPRGWEGNSVPPPCWDWKIPTKTEIYKLKWVNMRCEFRSLKMKLHYFFLCIFTLFSMSIPLQSLYLRHTAGCQIS